MEKVIYLKKLDDYEEVLKSKRKILLNFKRFIFLYKNLFNIITKKKIEEFNVWILPFQEKISSNKLEKILLKQIKNLKLSQDTKLVIADSLKDYNIINILQKYSIKYFTGKEIKKILVFKVLEYINQLQKKELNTREVTVLVDNDNEINMYILKQLAINCKTLKVVSKKIYKFKALEENLFNEFGIAIQFSNSYKKSLIKTEIIINLDFNNIDINEYEINNKAIIINTQEQLKIKSKLFNGIVINSYGIKMAKEITEKFKQANLLHKYDNLILYESIININNLKNIEEKIEKDKVRLLNLIGNNGVINKKEFKIVN